jgi:hypothetical protein
MQCAKLLMMYDETLAYAKALHYITRITPYLQLPIILLTFKEEALEVIGKSR